MSIPVDARNCFTYTSATDNTESIVINAGNNSDMTNYIRMEAGTNHRGSAIYPSLHDESDLVVAVYATGTPIRAAAATATVTITLYNDTAASTITGGTLHDTITFTATDTACSVGDEALIGILEFNRGATLLEYWNINVAVATQNITAGTILACVQRRSEVVRT